MLPAQVDRIVADLAPLTTRFGHAGHRLFLVGGIVRDLVAGRPAGEQDLDLTTDAVPEQVKELVAPLSSAVWTQGERFGTIGCIIDGQDLEITTHRAEVYDDRTRKPDVVFSSDIEKDLSRRDFTVNAMAIELTGGAPALIDPFDGVGDLSRHVLRTPLDPATSFSDDPLRMLRAARFTAGFGLDPTAELTRSMTELRDRMSIVSRERIRDEVVKMLAVPDPAPGLELLERTGLLRVIAPELADRTGRPDAARCHSSAWEHTIKLTAAVRAEQVLRVAALLGRTGDAPDPPDDTPDDSPDLHQVQDRLREWRFSNDVTADVLDLLRVVSPILAASLAGPELASPEFAGPELDDAGVRRLARTTSGEFGAPLELAAAEAGMRHEVDPDAAARVDAIARRIATLARNEDLGRIVPELDGAAVMEHLGIEPGRDVGRALAHLLEQRIVGGPRDRSSELADLDRWWEQHGG